MSAPGPPPVAAIADACVRLGLPLRAAPPEVRLAITGSAAKEIIRRELGQARRLEQGQALRAQLRFHDYLAINRRDPSYGFREHLRAVGGAIET